MVEADRVGGHTGVIGRDDLLRRYIQDLFHHVLFATNLIEKRNDDAQAGLQCASVASETLDGPIPALGDEINAFSDQDNREENQNQSERF